MHKIELTSSHHKQYDYIIAGAAGGFVSRAVVQPLDVVKIRFQLQVEPIDSKSSGKYHGIVQAVRIIIKEEGFQAFWKGHISSQIQAVSFSLVQFSTYEFCNTYLTNVDGDNSSKMLVLSSLKPFLLGSIAGSLATILTQPFDVLRTRFAAQGEPKIYTSLAYAIGNMVRHEGLHGLFRGLVPSLLLIAPQTGFQFFFYHLTNNIIDLMTSKENSSFDPNKGHKIGLLQSAFSGGVAGSMAKICVYPFDIIKKRMQVQGFEEARSKFGKLHISRGFLRCISVIFASEKFGGFFKGMQMSVIKSFMSLGLRFSVYEQVCDIILNIRDKVI